jgi:hypothetical protein
MSFNEVKYMKIVIFLLVPIILFLSSLAGPVAENFIPLYKQLGIDVSNERVAARAILVYHVLAMMAITFGILLSFKFIKIAENLKPLITNLALLGMFITAISGIIFAYFIPSPVAHSFWILGLALMFITGIIYIYAISPLKVSYKVQSKEYASVFSCDVTQLAFFITIILFLLSAMLGGYYASHFGFNEDVKVFLLEEHSTKEYRGLVAPSTPLELSVSAHAHAAVALFGVALMLIGFRWLDFKGKLHKIAAYFTLIGVFPLTYGSWSVMWDRPRAHIIVNAGVGLLELALLFLVIFGIMKVIKYDGFKNALKDGIKLGVFITVILMAILDAFSGPVVAMRIREVRSVWPIEDEIVYNVAHWHLLALTFGIIMFLLYLELSLKGFSRSLISWLTVGGFAFVIIGGFFYMLSPMFVGTPVHEIAIRSLEIKNNVLPIIEIGATLLLISLLFTFFKLLKIK